jgi:hypothetical protein
MPCGLDILGSVPGRRKIFLFSIASREVLRPTQLPIQWVHWTISLGVKRQGREAHSSQSNLEVKNGVVIPKMFPWFAIN